MSHFGNCSSWAMLSPPVNNRPPLTGETGDSEKQFLGSNSTPMVESVPQCAAFPIVENAPAQQSFGV